jgi:hypothetical protein
MQARTYPKEKPYLHRLTHLGVAAVERGPAFVKEVRQVIWSGEINNCRCREEPVRCRGR